MKLQQPGFVQSLLFASLLGLAPHTIQAAQLLPAPRGRAIAPELGFVGSRLALALNVSTLGLGGDLVFGLSRYLSLRAGAHFASAQPSFESHGMAHEVKLYWKSVQALVDFHPLGNVLRISAGAVVNGNGASVVSMSTEPVIVWDTTYQAADAGQVMAKVSFKQIAPYLGLGLGGGGRVRFTLDLGVMFQGRPRQTYTTTTSLPEGWSSLFEQMVEKEVTKVQGQINNTMYLRFYPVVSLGMSVPLR